MTREGPSYSKRIAGMSFVCTILVVLMHITYNIVPGGGFWWFFKLVPDGVCKIAVPYFFVVSGFFLAKHFGEANWYANELSKRIKSLAVPYLFWSLAWLVLCVAIRMLANAASHESLWRNFPDAREMIDFAGLNPLRPPAIGVLWYVRTLMLLVLVSPLLFKILRRFGCYALVVMFALQLLNVYDFGVMPLRSAISAINPFTAVFYFSVGVCAWGGG